MDQSWHPECFVCFGCSAQVGDRAHICQKYHKLYLWRKICHVEKFQIPVKNLSNLWSFIEIYAVFDLNLYGEKSVWRKSLWRKNDKYEVWLELLMSFTSWWCWWLMAQFVGGFFLFMVVLDNKKFTSTSLARFRWFAVVASNIVVRTSRVWLM